MIIGCLLFQLEGLEIFVLGACIKAGTLFLDPGKVTMTKDLGIGIIDLQAAEQCDQSMLLSGGTGIGGIAVGIEASFVADSNAVGIVAAGMGSNHILGAALVHLAILGDVVVVADGFEAAGFVTGFEGFHREILCNLGCGAMKDD